MMVGGPDEVPYLTIIATGRNDDFGGDFNGRFFRALHFNHRQLAAAGITHEFVFVEWRPIDRRPLLASVLADEFAELRSLRLRSYVVDPAYHDALSLNPRLQFQEFIAKNVGVRRALGEFVLTTNTDIYLSRGVIACLQARALEPGVLYRAARHDLRSDQDVSVVDWNLLEDNRNCDVINTIRPPMFTNASGDFLLLDRQTSQRLRGFNEVYRVAKIHIDGNFCVKAYASGIRIVDIGAPVYHVGRGTLHAQIGMYRARSHEAPWGDMRWKSDMIYENSDAWGLGLARERAIDRGTTFLAFDWHAVGPMVDLGRVMSSRKRQERAS